ncbi:DUF2894 domain-containing protein [Caballeronia sp. LZ043]|uniref:DUF2894 domain-containing protein n=1 Tax=Caballeronia sp. LZ043 TaxID=3038569 RepID=UPI00285CDD5E|nr:DUF2894 domain-containing protein [Caballeronia sp. LZ043]MDR5823243.1 DUF2894 domain-containing protein [Caballeronia sp. LZ043]
MTDSVTRAREMLDAWRERGDARVGGMSCRIIEALTQRASYHEGDARRVLNARLAALLDAQESADEPTAVTQDTLDTPFAALLDELNQRAQARPAPAEYLDALRAVWTSVSAEKRLRESLAQVPKNAGPLNSSSLVHRSLALMGEVSPDYLQHFLGYVDALSWMDALTLVSAPVKDAPRAASQKKTARGKAR